ncbi:Amino-acid acetyltransferase [Gammaproteobacteria bacterium]
MSSICPSAETLVASLRGILPYINAHRGQVFVIYLSGKTIQGKGLPHLIHDLVLLASLGVQLVLVHGARPQIEERLRQQGLSMHYEHGLRVTDPVSLTCVLEAVGVVKTKIEALLSQGLVNSPMAGAQVRVTSGNFVTARPLGVRHGIDYQHTGEVRRIDAEALRQHLGSIVLLSPIGYSPTGEVFNLNGEAVATATAVALSSDKLVFLADDPGLFVQNRWVRQTTLEEIERLLNNANETLKETVSNQLVGAVFALKHGVKRVHLVSSQTDGALLLEFLTRDGSGTLIDHGHYEGLRPASIEDIGGILELIKPLETEGILVRRPRERLEMEIDQFVVAERDGAILACAALYPFPEDRLAELACLAVHPDYRGQKRGEALLAYMEQLAKKQNIHGMFVLTTHTAHWFQERGFEPVTLSTLPMTRQNLYNWKRGAKIFLKLLV